MDERQIEDEILVEFRARGITHPIPTNETADDPCPVWRESILKKNHNTHNLGPPDDCSLACRLEAEDG